MKSNRIDGRMKRLRRYAVAACAVAMLVTLLPHVEASASSRLLTPNPKVTLGGLQSKGAGAKRLSATEGEEPYLPSVYEPLDYVPGEILVRFKDDVATVKKEETMKAAGAARAESLTQPPRGQDIRLLKLEPGTTEKEALQELMFDPNIECASPNYTQRSSYIPSTPDFTQQWSMRNYGQVIIPLEGALGPMVGTPGADIDAWEAWDIEKGESNPVTVAVIDSGIDYDHPNLKDKLWTNTGEVMGNDVDDDGNGYVDDYHGYSFTGIQQAFGRYGDPLVSTGDLRRYAQSFTAQAEAGQAFLLKSVTVWIIKKPDSSGDEPTYGLTVSAKKELDGEVLGSYRIEPEEVGTSVTKITKYLDEAVGCLDDDTYYIEVAADTVEPPPGNTGYYQVLTSEFAHGPKNRKEDDFYLEGCGYRGVGTSWLKEDYVDMTFATNPYDYAHDLSGHGTCCAGIVAAADIGSGPVGVAFGSKVKVMPLQVTGEAGEATDWYLLNAINYASNNGADIISMSLGGYDDNPVAESIVLDAWDAGLVMFAAAGNSGYPAIEYPAGYDYVNGISATDNRDVVTWWSNHNSEVSFSAPGDHVWTTMPTYDVCMNLDGWPHDASQFSGTSAATPHVAGAAALLLSKDPSLSNTDVEQALIDTAEDLGDAGWDEYSGWGRINACAALGGVSTPVIDTLDPDSGQAGSVVKAKGRRFGRDQGDSRILMDDVEVPVQSWKDGEIAFVVPDDSESLPPGSHLLTVERGIKKSTPVTFEIVTSGITSVEPSFGCRGQSLTVDITGIGTNFQDGTSVAVFDTPDGITVDSTDVTDPTHATATVTIAGDAEPGWRSVTVETVGEVPGALQHGFEVREARISAVWPAEVYPGKTLDVQVTGTGTHFEDGVSQATFSGDGMTLNSTAVTDSTHAVANVTVSPTAALGSRDVNVVTGVEVPRKGKITVINPKVLSITPKQAYEGDTLLDVDIVGEGTEFSPGVTNAQFLNDSYNPATGITVNSTIVTDATHARANITIGRSLPDTTLHVRVETGGAYTDRYYPFTVKKGYMKSVEPHYACPGQTLDVQIVGVGTHFEDGVTTVSYERPADLTVNSVTVDDATHLTANVTISETAVVNQFVGTIVTTGAEVVSSHGTPSTVNIISPRILSVSPDYVRHGQTLDVDISGYTRGFTAGSTVSFTPPDGITVNSTTVIDSNRLRVNLTVSYATAPGNRDILVKTGSEEINATGWDGLNVRAPEITRASPIFAYPGETLDVGIWGYGTGFLQGTSAATFSGDGITVNSTTVQDTGHATANITVASGATPGKREVNVLTSGETPTPYKEFVVNEPIPPGWGLPAVYRVTPELGPPGTEVTVGGAGFGNSRGDGDIASASASYVSFNGVEAASYAKWSDTEIVCTVPEGSAAGPVTVVVNENTSKEDKAFTVVSNTWYLAEGSTDHGFDTYITIENPTDTEVHAGMTYYTTGGPVSGDTLALPPESQLTVNPAGVLGKADFSTRVECLEGRTIAVDRTMTWTGSGAASPEAHSSVGVPLPGTTWYLPEGSSNWGFETWLLIQNPNGREASCDVTYMIEGEGPRTVNHRVAANSRATFSMEADIGNRDASIRVVSDLPVIPERAMYRNNRREGLGSIGATTPASDCYLAEGAVGFDSDFTTYILVQNPNSGPADVTLTYMTASGLQEGPAFRMPADSRKTVRVNDYLPPGTSVSTKVHASLPVIAERSMYWDSGRGEACHDSVGLSMPHATFYLPDGQTSDGHETWTLVQNPNGEDVSVEITYMTPSGQGSVTRTETIPANSRKTFSMQAHSGITGRAAIMVTSKTEGKKVMVERAMYWNSRGAGTDTIGGYGD